MLLLHEYKLVTDLLGEISLLVEKLIFALFFYFGNNLIKISLKFIMNISYFSDTLKISSYSHASTIMVLLQKYEIFVILIIH